MADLNLAVSAGECAVTNVAKTFLTLKAPTNQRIRIKGIEIFGKGTSNTDTPVKVELGRITTDGQTGTATAVTPDPLDEDSAETPQGTYYKNYGTEPTTYGHIMRVWEVHPQTGLVVYFPLHDEIKLAGGKEMGIRLTSNQNETMALNVIVEE
jgi:hypothetical protein